MKRLLTGLICAALGVATANPAPAKEGDDAKADRGKQSASKQDTDGGAGAKNHQHGKVQTIRGTVAGVTTIGEAVIDPQSRTAVEVEADYLTVLGSPREAGGQQAGNSGDSGSGQADADKNSEDRSGGRADRGGRQNVYLVAITPQTAVRLRQSGDSGKEGNDDKDGKEKKQDASRQAFDKLEIGDRVEVEFINTGRVNASSHGNAGQADDSNRTADRDAKSSASSDRGKHGHDRIMIGDAKSITILSTPGSRSESDRDGAGGSSNAAGNSSQPNGQNDRQ